MSHRAAWFWFAVIAACGPKESRIIGIADPLGDGGLPRKDGGGAVGGVGGPTGAMAGAPSGGGSAGATDSSPPRDAGAVSASGGARAVDASAGVAGGGGTTVPVQVPTAGAMGGGGATVPPPVGVAAGGAPVEPPQPPCTLTPRGWDAGLAMLAYESFSVPATTVLHGFASGEGWAAPWVVQTADVTPNAFAAVTLEPLVSCGLSVSPGHAVGGRDYLSAGRALDVSAKGPFASFLTADGFVGKAGTTLWFSAVMRRDGASDRNFHVSWHPNDQNDIGVTWDDDPSKPSRFAVGLWGDGDDPNDKGTWTLMVRDPSGKKQFFESTIPVKVGQATLVVLSVGFDATSTVSLYVNPPPGAAPPASPTVATTTPTPLTFRDFYWYPGRSPGSSSLDEVRVGPSFASVTQ